MYRIYDLNDPKWYLVSADSNHTNSGVNTVVTQSLTESIQLPYGLARTVAALYNKAFPERKFGLEAVINIAPSQTPRKEFFEKIEALLHSLNYKIEKNEDEEFLVALSTHVWVTTPKYPDGYAASAVGKRKLSLRYSKDKDDERIFFGIREDYDTRYVYNGIIRTLEDIVRIDNDTKILPLG